MSKFQIDQSGRPPVVLDAANWLGALGQAVELSDADGSLDQLVCEVISQSTVVAMDLASGLRWRLVDVELARSANEQAHAAPAAPAAPAAFRPPAPPAPASAARRTAFSPPRGLVEDSGGTHFESVDDAASEESGSFALDVEAVTSDELDGIEQAPSANLAWSVALDHALRRVPSEGGAAIMVNAMGGLLFVDTAGPHGRQLRGIVLPHGTGLVGQCIARREAVLVDDAHKDARFFQQMDNLTRFRTRAVVCVPVHQAGTMYGALELMNPTAPRKAYDSQALKAIEGVAAALARRLSAGRP